MDSLNIGGLVAHHARYRPQANALSFGGGWLSWQQLDARVGRLAAALSGAGVGHGDRVVTVLANCVELIDVYWACARIGAVAVPLSPLLPSYWPRRWRPSAPSRSLPPRSTGPAISSRRPAPSAAPATSRWPSSRPCAARWMRPTHARARPPSTSAAPRAFAPTSTAARRAARC